MPREDVAGTVRIPDFITQAKTQFEDQNFSQRTAFREAFIRGKTVPISTPAPPNDQQPQTTRRSFGCWVCEIRTYPSLIRVYLRGYVSARFSTSTAEEGYTFSFPPNDTMYLDEIKRAQSNRLYVGGEFDEQLQGPIEGRLTYLSVYAVKEPT